MPSYFELVMNAVEKAPKGTSVSRREIFRYVNLRKKDSVMVKGVRTTGYIKRAIQEAVNKGYLIENKARKNYHLPK